MVVFHSVSVPAMTWKEEVRAQRNIVLLLIIDSSAYLVTKRRNPLVNDPLRIHDSNSLVSPLDRSCERN